MSLRCIVVSWLLTTPRTASLRFQQRCSRCLIKGCFPVKKPSSFEEDYRLWLVRFLAEWQWGVLPLLRNMRMANMGQPYQMKAGRPSNFSIKSSPRTLSLAHTATWFVFTDASYEPQQPSAVAGIGAVLVDQYGKRCGFISLFLDENLLQCLNATNRKTIIFECELLAIFLAMHCWSDRLCKSQVVVCTDNEGVKDVLIACQTSSTNATPVLCAILRLEFELKWNAWFSRVPTESNIADDPSRGQIQKFLDNLSTMWTSTSCGQHCCNFLQWEALTCFLFRSFFTGPPTAALSPVK